MEKLPYHYRVTVCKYNGNLVERGDILSSINLDGIVREDLFIKDNPDTYIAHVWRNK